MKTVDFFKKYFAYSLVLAGLLVTSCSSGDDAAPEEEHDHELITDIHLTFTNTSDANDVVEVEANDPDGEGPQDYVIDEAINLGTGKTYKLTFEILNNSEHDEDEDHDDHDHGDEEEHGEEIHTEIKEEADEHQIFFQFTENAFSSPIGDGNFDNAADPVNYLDQDENENPLGLETSWTAGTSAVTDGKFTVKLVHQPVVSGVPTKTATSTSDDGDADFTLTFDLNITVSK